MGIADVETPRSSFTAVWSVKIIIDFLESFPYNLIEQGKAINYTNDCFLFASTYFFNCRHRCYCYTNGQVQGSCFLCFNDCLFYSGPGHTNTGSRYYYCFKRRVWQHYEITGFYYCAGYNARRIAAAYRQHPCNSSFYCEENRVALCRAGHEHYWFYSGLAGVLRFRLYGAERAEPLNSKTHRHTSNYNECFIGNRFICGALFNSAAPRRGCGGSNHWR